MRKIATVIQLIFAFVLISATLQAQDIVGVWKTIDDDTGEAKSHVEIYKQNGKYYGKVIKILNEDKADAVCEECDENDPRYNQPILGMVIVKDLEKDDDEYEDGTILDPNNGSVYDCTMWLEDGNLKVRGYWGFLYRTQTWYKVR